MKKPSKKTPAFTLVEAILYTLIVTVISATMILSLYELIKVKAAIEKEREVVENLRFAAGGITKLLRAGHEVAAGTGSETNPAAIRVYLDESNSTFFDLDTDVKPVPVGDHFELIRYLQYSLNGSQAVPITADTVSVTSFTLQQLNVADEPMSIQMVIVLEHASGAGDTLSSLTSVSLRQ